MKRGSSLLVTGANGFVGSALLSRLVSLPESVSGYKVRASVRGLNAKLPVHVDSIFSADLAPETDWRIALENIDVIIHAASRVHVMDDEEVNPLAEYRRINVDGTLNLARQAAHAGVKRFIFISSIKVNGEGTPLDVPYGAEDMPRPVDPYGVSKYEAEVNLRKVAKETGMELVVIRPPLVYGPGVKANFLSMMCWLYKGIPLPLGAIRNKRSLVALDNLVDLIVTCIEHPAAANQTFLVSDGEDLSTTELLKRTGAALGKPARLMAMPPRILMAMASLAGKQAFAHRLCGSLQVDISKTRELLGWNPPVNVDEALKKTAQDFLSREAR